MDDPANILFLPVIALVEACWIVARGRTRIPSVADLLADVDADPRIRLVPLNREIVDISVTITSVGEMHDRLIVATTLHLASIHGKISLLSRDENIKASGLVPIVW
jgi:PIN domain nuclease of toxin-antitoxin system